MKPDEATTYLAFAQLDEVGGRFAGAVGPTHIIGATAAPAPVAGGKRDPVPDEPPLSPDENPAYELEPISLAQEAPEPRASSKAQGSGDLTSGDVPPIMTVGVERGVGSPPLPRLRRL
jgi:hypothetical protein